MLKRNPSEYNQINFHPLNKIAVLGNLTDSIGGGSIGDNPRYSCLRPGFQRTESGNYFFYTAGYESVDGEFFPCPLSIFYVQINFYQIEKKEANDAKETQFISDLKVFDKKFQLFKDIAVKFNTGNLYESKWLCNLVNALNLFVEGGNPIDTINTQIIQELRFEPPNPEIFLMIINKLAFRFYYDDCLRVGKDNSSWEVIEISDLPESRYLIQLFAKILDGTQNGNLITVTYNHDYFYASCSGRKEIEVNLDKIEEVKDLLKLNVLKQYDYLEDIFYQIKVSTYD